MSKRALTIALVAAAMMTTAGTGFCASTSEASYSLQLTGYVPVICRADLSSNQAPANGTAVPLGQMSEFCNNAAGYQVWIDYSPSLAGDTITVGDQQVTLNASGSALIDASTGPTAAVSKSVTLNTPTGAVSGTVSVRVVTL